MEKTIYNEHYRELLVWLRQERKKRKLTMRDVAATLQVPPSWICKIEQGERRLDVWEFSELCEVIGCDAHDGLTYLQQKEEPLRYVADGAEEEYGARTN